MQTIARANRVFPQKDNGLIVDYVGVFRNLEKALAIYGAASASESPIEIIDALAGELDAAVADLIAFCANFGVDLPAMRDADGFDHIAKRDAAVEALLVDEETRNDFIVRARQVRKLFKALLPNPKAAAQQRTVAAIRVLPRAHRCGHPTARGGHLSRGADAVDALLDRSVGAEEYVIRTAAEGTNRDPLIDLSLIDLGAAPPEGCLWRVADSGGGRRGASGVLLGLLVGVLVDWDSAPGRGYLCVFGALRSGVERGVANSSAVLTACSEAISSLATRSLSRRLLSNHGW